MKIFDLKLTQIEAVLRGSRLVSLLLSNLGHFREHLMMKANTISIELTRQVCETYAAPSHKRGLIADEIKRILMGAIIEAIEAPTKTTRI